MGTARMDIGIAWGWRVLTNDWSGDWGVSDYPRPPNQAAKHLVFLTDGHTIAYEFEMSETAPWGWNNGSPDGFANMERVCDEAKADGITVHVFAINPNP